MKYKIINSYNDILDKNNIHLYFQVYSIEEETFVLTNEEWYVSFNKQ